MLNYIPLPHIIYILGTHYVFDFLLQSHWMASNKSKNNLALLAHVLVYTIGLTWCSFACIEFPLEVGLWWVGFNMIAHFITDWITSRISSAHFGKDWHKFFCVIGADQCIHYSTLFLSYIAIQNFLK